MGNDIWTIKGCLDWTRGYLERRGDEKARLAAEWMLTAATGLTRVELFMDFDRPLTSDELTKMRSMIKRRAAGEPLQYVTGETSFRFITVSCAPGVLIPRPETELLVDEVLSYIDAEVAGGSALRERAVLAWNSEVEERRAAEEHAAAEKVARQEGASGDAGGASSPAPGEEPAADAEGTGGGPGTSAGEHPSSDVRLSPEAPLPPASPAAASPADQPRVARVLEIGTGTGCIALSLAHERPGRVRVLATDIAPEAVALARKNRAALGLDGAVVIRQGDCVDPIRSEELGTFDVLVSNPPYIPEAVMEGLPDEVVQFEPRLALASGPDGLDMFRRIVGAAPRVLRTGGLLACELHETKLDAAAEICRRAGMVSVRVVDDLAGRPRIVLARMP